MLVDLTVENYAVVEKVRVRFHRGLNLLTGETGSGKSIVVDALALLFGARAAAEMVRTGAERARISGIFEVDAAHLPEGVEAEDGELIIEREILANGKSRAFAGGRPVTAAVLREIAERLGDIHGQHDQQQLFDPKAQREMLDAFRALALGLARLPETWLRTFAKRSRAGARRPMNWPSLNVRRRKSCGRPTCGSFRCRKSRL